MDAGARIVIVREGDLRIESKFRYSTKITIRFPSRYFISFIVRLMIFWRLSWVNNFGTN